MEGMISSTLEVDCADDLAAVQRARFLQKRLRMEIWQGNRLVTALDFPLDLP
ncbi:hypothetical protein KHC28_14315 [Ancylobacter sonchi]|uniref:hypothetical protein n=1 Tax=Ancylobacter TaxID=99 RepID=UPI001BD52505|nr:MULTISPECIES: hypothetical protein [Ancylobacter]MBS7534833.1 hypothetical protein [Ancylobacter sonchi]MCB4770485.1 hypothetical protein [Ancylobacter sp. Lp-2]